MTGFFGDPPPYNRNGPRRRLTGGNSDSASPGKPCATLPLSFTTRPASAEVYAWELRACGVPRHLAEIAAPIVSACAGWTPVPANLLAGSFPAW